MSGPTDDGSEDDVVPVHRFGADTYTTPEQAARESLTTARTTRANVALQQGHDTRARENETVTGIGKAALGGLIGSASAGVIDPFQDAQDFHGITSTLSGLAGAIAPALLGDEAGLVSAFRDPLEAERGASALSSKFLLGGEVGGEAGTTAKAAEKGLAKAGDVLSGAADTTAVPEDLAALDMNGLAKERKLELARINAERDAQSASIATERKAELDRIAAESDAQETGLSNDRKAELDRIESDRVGQRAQLAEDLGAHRELAQDEKIWIATQGDDAKEIGNVSEIGAQSKKADDAIRNLLNNPESLAERPGRIIEPLQRQRNALMRLQTEEPELRRLFAADTSGERAAALDKIPGALDRNRALEAKARELIATPASDRLAEIDSKLGALKKSVIPTSDKLEELGRARAALRQPATSARLEAIEHAKDVLRTPAAPRGMLEDVLAGTVMHHVAGFATGMPIIGPALGAKAGRFVSDLVFGRLGKATGEIAARTKSAVSAFTGAVARSKLTPVLASRVLANVRYAPAGSVPEPIPVKGESKLATAFKQRAAELKTQTQYGPDGKPVMRQDARLAMADQLAALRAMDSIGADQIEAIAAARVEFLSSKLPRKPSINGIPVGPDHWQPSDMEMRQFARYAAAVEDPGGVEERAVHGAVTPEDAEAYHAVYPARAQHFLNEILGNLPGLRTSLPYARRLALSIFAGAPVDPALDPRILKVLQGQFDEPNSKGGTQQPQANPQFGSVSKSVEKPTPAQSRSG